MTAVGKSKPISSRILYILLFIFLRDSVVCPEKILETFNSFFHNVEKRSNFLLKSCSVNTARFLKYVWTFFNIMNESYISQTLSLSLSFLGHIKNSSTGKMFFRLFQRFIETF